MVKERSLLYRQDLMSFFVAIDLSLDLAQCTFVGVGQLLRVLNAGAEVRQAMRGIPAASNVTTTSWAWPLRTKKVLVRHRREV